MGGESSWARKITRAAIEDAPVRVIVVTGRVRLSHILATLEKHLHDAVESVFASVRVGQIQSDAFGSTHLTLGFSDFIPESVGPGEAVRRVEEVEP